MPDGSAAERFAKALQHKMNGEYDEAEALLKSVLVEQPTNADAYHELGLTYSYRVFIDESIEALERAVQLVPNSTKYLLDLGKTHSMYGDYDKAKPVFQRILELDPFNDEALKNLQYLG
jgi:tetratricopeptide (TPR) repeat protein